MIPPTRLDDDALAGLIARMRNPEERRGDFRAQLAAHHLAGLRVDELCARRGRETVAAAMDELYAYSERVVRASLAALPDGRYEAEDVLEGIRGDLVIRAAVTIAGDAVEIDFDGTAPQHDGNLNCPLAVARSASYFVVRCVTDPDLPASGGAFAPVTVNAPEGCLVNARAPAAVAAGNVETSSRIVDVLFAALGQAVDVPAQGQGTVNNVTLGNERYTYYETIGGGQGACSDADGPPGVHVAMSNTLSTPVEALELQYPLRVERYALRSARRYGRASRRRRCRARAPRARAVPPLADHRAPSARAVRCERRRGRRDGAEPPQRPRASGESDDRPRNGRRGHDRDAGRRRSWSRRVGLRRGGTSRGHLHRSTEEGAASGGRPRSRGGGPRARGQPLLLRRRRAARPCADPDRGRGARGRRRRVGDPAGRRRERTQRAHERDRPERARRRTLPRRRRRVHRRRALRAVHDAAGRDATRRDQGVRPPRRAQRRHPHRRRDLGGRRRRAP